MPVPLFVLGATISAFVLDSFSEASERSFRHQKLRERLNYSDRALCTVFAEQSDLPDHVVLAAWHEAARILKVEPGKLRPADRLSVELGFPAKLRSSRSDVDRLVGHVRRRLQERQCPHRCHLRTFHDVVHALATARLHRPGLKSG